MQILVKNQDWGFWAEQAITVQRFLPAVGDYEEELVYCNHAGATEEHVESHYYTPDARDLEWATTIKVCDKCPAWYKDDGLGWEDAPSNGVHNG